MYNYNLYISHLTFHLINNQRTLFCIIIEPTRVELIYIRYKRDNSLIVGPPRSRVSRRDVPSSTSVRRVEWTRKYPPCHSIVRVCHVWALLHKPTNNYTNRTQALVRR